MTIPPARSDSRRAPRTEITTTSPAQRSRNDPEMVTSSWIMTSPEARNYGTLTCVCRYGICRNVDVVGNCVIGVKRGNPVLTQFSEENRCFGDYYVS